MLRANDHAGAGLMMSRLGEGGKLNKGPMGMGLRLQETMRVGAFKVCVIIYLFRSCCMMYELEATGNHESGRVQGEWFSSPSLHDRDQVEATVLARA